MHNVDTVELNSSTAPTKDEAMKMKMAERVEESGVDVAITRCPISTTIILDDTTATLTTQE